MKSTWGSLTVPYFIVVNLPSTVFKRKKLNFTMKRVLDWTLEVCLDVVSSRWGHVTSSRLEVPWALPPAMVHCTWCMGAGSERQAQWLILANSHHSPSSAVSNPLTAQAHVLRMDIFFPFPTPCSRLFAVAFSWRLESGQQEIKAQLWFPGVGKVDIHEGISFHPQMCERASRLL